MKSFDDVIRDINDSLLGKMLQSISGRATPFKIVEINDEKRNLYIDMNGKQKSRPFDELERIWQEMRSKPAVHVESFLGGSGSSRNQPETILANLPYVEWLLIEGKKHIAYVDEYTHEPGTIRQMDDERLKEYQAAMSDPHPRNPILDDYDQTDTNRVQGGCNVLLYGVPGCGKSHTVRTEYCDNPQRMEVIVFHPDYTYSDFVGQILPKVEGERIFYEYTPGPFTRLLRKAQDTPEQEFYLVIEEINRGNAPAIFGEIFQLLDRKPNGESEYNITNPEIAKIVYNGDESRPVCLPSNFFIVASMNTSDQNVFTLDTAFQRRWYMRMIQNDVWGAKHANSEILDTGVTWGEFCETINARILDSNIGMSSAEDKRLGAYFVRPEDIVLDPMQYDDNASALNKRKAARHNSLFPEKILKYLWDDAFKFTRDHIFATKYQSLEPIVADFKKKRGFDRFSVFLAGIFQTPSKEDIGNAQ